MRSIALIDLAAQQARIRDKIDSRIARVLDHGQYIMGPEVAELESALAHFCGAKHAITCSSGTDALLIAMLAKGVKPGDGVLCPAFTYTANPEMIALIGAIPVFIDVDPSTFNITADSVEAGVSEAMRLGIKPVAVIPVDLFGLPAPYDSIHQVADRHGLWVLADAAQSFGATISTRKTGTFGDITATSFFPAKPLGCYGDGGAIFTDDDTVADIMRSIRLHGKGSDKYDIVRVGVNGRLDTIQAAVLLEKLAIFEDEIARRNQIAARYTQALDGHVEVPRVTPGATSIWAQYTVRLPANDRDRAIAHLKAKKIPTAVYYPRAVHQQPAYHHYCRAGIKLETSERLASEVLSLPMHPYLSADDQNFIINELRTAIR